MLDPDLYPESPSPTVKKTYKNGVWVIEEEMDSENNNGDNNESYVYKDKKLLSVPFTFDVLYYAETDMVVIMESYAGRGNGKKLDLYVFNSPYDKYDQGMLIGSLRPKNKTKIRTKYDIRKGMYFKVNYKRGSGTMNVFVYEVRDLDYEPPYDPSMDGLS